MVAGRLQTGRRPQMNGAGCEHLPESASLQSRFSSRGLLALFIHPAAVLPVRPAAVLHVPPPKGSPRRRLRGPSRLRSLQPITQPDISLNIDRARAQTLTLTSLPTLHSTLEPLPIFPSSISIFTFIFHPSSTLPHLRIFPHVHIFAHFQ